MIEKLNIQPSTEYAIEICEFNNGLWKAVYMLFSFLMTQNATVLINAILRVFPYKRKKRKKKKWPGFDSIDCPVEFKVSIDNEN